MLSPFIMVCNNILICVIIWLMSTFQHRLKSPWGQAPCLLFTILYHGMHHIINSESIRRGIVSCWALLELNSKNYQLELLVIKKPGHTPVTTTQCKMWWLLREREDTGKPEEGENALELGGRLYGGSVTTIWPSMSGLKHERACKVLVCILLATPVTRQSQVSTVSCLHEFAQEETFTK